MPTPASSLPADGRRPEPTHGCVRCGARIPIEASMCEACNPLGLKAPAASQAHGTVFLGIAAAVVIMMVVARALIADVGPFEAAVTRLAPDPAGLVATVTITNRGTSAGSTTCRIDDPTRGGIGPRSLFVASPQVAGGATVEFDVVVPAAGTPPRELVAACAP